MRFWFFFLKDALSYLCVCIVVVLLFVFYYFIVPDYWFLCSIFTIIIVGIFDVFFFSGNKIKKKKGRNN